PTPVSELRSRFCHATDLEVLEHCMGINRIRMGSHQNPAVKDARDIADQLAPHTILLCVDTEHYTLNSDEMTEVGIAVMKRQHAAPISEADNYGDHGENLMKQANFCFYRFREKAHLPTTNAASLGPAGNRFGEARFVTFADARNHLRQIFVQPITNVRGLQRYNHPIVIMGHAVGHDREHLNGKDLGFHPDAVGTVVRYIDTQQVVRDTKRWKHPDNDIGLPKLVAALGFEHTDAHSAANDIGRTLMCAVLLAIPLNARRGCKRTADQVSNDFEHWSRNTFVGIGGTREYCCKCGSDHHMDSKCSATGMRCNNCINRGFDQQATTHISMHCPWVCDEVAAERLAWFADQPSHDEEKYKLTKARFSSRLQRFSHNAPRIPPEAPDEIAARRVWYDNERNVQRRSRIEYKIKPFVWWKRSYQS
ncbi:hypothetical protein EK21DRAFT_27247, partial [Setomelanomma holmii]